jgi:hypothetical protein
MQRFRNGFKCNFITFAGADARRRVLYYQRSMPGTANSLTLELLAWISRRPRTYAETMEAWRSTCPRHSVWEDAWVDGLIEVVEGGETMDQSQVALTGRGRGMLRVRCGITVEA